MANPPPDNVSAPSPLPPAQRSALWQAVKRHQPHLSDQEVDELLHRTAQQERELVLKHKLNLDQARELVREELFPPKVDEREEETLP